MHRIVQTSNLRLLMLTVLKLHSYEGITSASMAAVSHSYMLEVLELHRQAGLPSLGYWIKKFNLHMVYKEMQATLTMVANRKFTVLRTCLQIDQGTWVIAELSHVRAPNTYRRLPSGCLIEHITGDVSKVTWVEHMEVDEPLPNRSGFAFRAERIVAWLERSCERGSHMNATCHIENPCYEGKEKNMLAFYEDIVVVKDESGQRILMSGAWRNEPNLDMFKNFNKKLNGSSLRCFVAERHMKTGVMKIEVEVCKRRRGAQTNQSYVILRVLILRC
ncbi:homeobox-leucine zipper protein HDG11 [Tanacetum coccineum]